MLRKHARCTSRSARYATYAHAVCQASEIANELLASYYAGELDRIELLYTTFISMISSMPTVRTLVPLLPSGLEWRETKFSSLPPRRYDNAHHSLSSPHLLCLPCLLGRLAL